MLEFEQFENRKMVRLILDHPLTVSIASLGADVRYELKTRNVSYTGFFLDFEKPGRFPFTAASIMEIWIELEKDERIFFNGKMVRKVMPGDPGSEITGPGIAVRIIQMESMLQGLWIHRKKCKIGVYYLYTII